MNYPIRVNNTSNNYNEYDNIPRIKKEKLPVPRSVAILPRPPSPGFAKKSVNQDHIPFNRVNTIPSCHTPFIDTMNPSKKPSPLSSSSSSSSFVSSSLDQIIDSNPAYTNRKSNNHFHQYDNLQASHWNVKALKEIDPHFPIERNHGIVTHLTPSEIAHNIVNCLQMNSIDAMYDNEEAIAYAKTSTGCKFRIHLFKHNDNNDVLVEVQRRSGCCVRFHTLVNRILSASKGREYNPSCGGITIENHHTLSFGTYPSTPLCPSS